MSEIIAFAGSNSTKSINHQWVSFLSQQLVEPVNVIRLTDYQIPMYGIDYEKEIGFPKEVKRLYKDIKSAKAIILSVNEHNGAVSSYFKNVMDWLSRYDRIFLEDKPILLTSTSPGKLAAGKAREYAEIAVERFGGKLIASFGLPSFEENFDSEQQKLRDETLLLGVKDTLSQFQQAIKF